MGDSDHGEFAVRIERGQADDEELAALTVALLALRARRAATSRVTTRPVDGVRWWKRADAYQAPCSWR
ncbi:acyl-CoA carboxylase epsilon subunit [Streptomyces sp. NPDC028635]|uniref:acyl-CoA carboxylase epsilon subunit n=1 Tax=Streptomyces sp. NPDC028635 TaxID=3154800 RepID=UPI0034107B77